MAKLRAFRVYIPDWKESEGIIAALSASKARYKAYRAANEAGYGVRFYELWVKRAKEFDCIIDHKCFSSQVYKSLAIDYAKQELEAYRQTLPKELIS